MFGHAPGRGRRGYARLRGLRGQASLFGDRGRITLPDELLVFGTGTDLERALLLYPPGLDYIAAYFGCLYAGVVALPAYPPRLNRPTPRIQGIVSDCQAKIVLTTTDIYENLERRFEQTPDLQALHWLDSQKLAEGLENSWRQPIVTPQSLAFLQYTSGSTSQPKGVMVSHANLLHNLGEIYCSFRLFDYDFDRVNGVNWLPSYHDMGLIGCILEPVYAQ